MPSKSLWGEFPTGQEAGRSPKTILSEQATALAEGTHKMLLGRVDTLAAHGDINHELVIIAPFLNKYEVAIVRAVHGAVMYPVKVYDLVANSLWGDESATEAEFESNLEKIFTSKKVQQIVSSLLSQSPSGPSYTPRSQR
jgi:hypothetical protein